MYEELDVTSTPRPALTNLVTEVPRTLLEMSALSIIWPLLRSLPKGDGHTVMVMPGFLAGDESTQILRTYLGRMGYRAKAWELGRNTGRFEIMANQLPSQFLKTVEQAKGKISLIGQSLGGVFARELARLYPEHVRQVIALGSPIRMDKSEAVAGLVQRLFEQSTGMSPEEMREALEFFDETSSPPVPMTAIYSKGDGVVHWQGCMEQTEDAITQNIQICGSHCGMAHNPSVFKIVADRLAQRDGEWQRYRVAPTAAGVFA